MIECPKCHKKNKEGTKFCVNCGQSLQENFKSDDNNEEQIRFNALFGNDNSNDETKIDESEKLKQEIDKLKSKLEKQKVEKESVDIFERITPNRHNFNKVIAFSERSSITIFGFFVLSVIFDSFRWWLLLILMVMLYFYPLLSSRDGFPWESKAHRWLHDEDSISKLKKKLNKSLSNREPLQKVQASKSQTNHEPDKSVTLNGVKDNGKVQTQKPVHKNVGFKYSTELWLGLISLIIGIVLYILGQNQVQDVGSQVSSVVQNGSLNNGGYFYLIGGVLAEFGGLAIVGGLVKGFSHNFSGGMIFKVIGVITLLIAAGLAMYVYANPVETAYSALNSGSSFGDLQNVLQIAKLIPWISGIIYIIGILISLTKKDN